VVEDVSGQFYQSKGFLTSAEGLFPSGSCPVCGESRLSAETWAVNATVVLRARLPQPMAAALLRTRALTVRERTVFEFLGFGYDNRSIARDMGISERTVKRYITAILTKLKLESRLQAGLTALIISSSSAAGTYWPEGRMDASTNAGDTVNVHTARRDNDL
jgi:DNA-binding CsgD family transcriptional regulator